MIDWIVTDLWVFGSILLSVTLMVAALIAMNRIFGLRSFSKMSGFDFAITVAFGSVVAGTVIAKDPPVAQGAAALLFLFLIQAIIAIARRKWDWASKLVNNEPRLVWRDGEYFEDQMSAAQVTQDDIIAKLREANAIRFEDVLAVVVETTGDVCVLHTTGDDRTIDDAVMQGVIGWDKKD